jgi:hypothetical protein
MSSRHMSLLPRATLHSDSEQYQTCILFLDPLAWLRTVITIAMHAVQVISSVYLPNNQPWMLNQLFAQLSNKILSSVCKSSYQLCILTKLLSLYTYQVFYFTG